MIQHLMSEIEGGSVYRKLMVANTPADVLRRLSEHPVLNEARDYLGTRPNEIQELLDRAIEIYERSEPPG